MSRITLAALALLLLAVAPAIAQDPTDVDPDHYQIVFENDQVRVLRITYGAGEKSVMHEHPDAVFVALTDNHIRMHLPNGETADGQNEKGEVSWTPADKHQPENVGDEMVGILVELKSPED
jgi:quercetin dioxygenase-like cupin family protein